MRGKRRFKGEVERDQGYRVNGAVRAAEVRLIDENSALVGVMSSREALAIAEEKGLDLIEIAPKAKPPTCKIMDYGKWRYENKKKEKTSRKKQTIVSVKEIQLRPRTDQHDIEVKLKNARKFLLAGDKVKFNLRFTGREMAHQDLGIGVLNSVIKQLDEITTVEALPKREGRQAFVIVAPDAAKIKDYNDKIKREDKLDAVSALEPKVELAVETADETVAKEKTEKKEESTTAAES